MSNKLNHFRVAQWEVDCRLGTLISAKHRQRLPPKLMSLLQQLALADGELVGREDLLQTVWGGAVVNEEVVSRAVAELRQALGDSAKQPSFIETIPKRGYRLVQTVEPIKPQPRKSLWPVLLGAFSVTIVLVLVISSAWITFNKEPLFVLNEIAVQSVTSDEGGETDPAVSDNGKLIVFAKMLTSGQSDLWMIDTESLVSRQLTEDAHFESNPVFSADGTRIAYLQHSTEGCSIIQFSIFDGEKRHLASCSPILRGLDWSADGTELVYLSQTANGASITRLDLHSGKSTVVTTNLIQGSTDQRPKYSADGQWINFIRGTYASRELYRIAVSGGQALPLTDDGRYVSDHAWVGGNVVFSSDRLGSRRLWFLDSQSGQVRSLGMPGANLLSTSRDGSYLAFESAHYVANIYKLQLDRLDHVPEKIITSNAYDNYPSLSPDGQWLTYNSNRSGVDSIWLASSDGGQAHMLYQQPGSRIVDASWSADGSWLLATQYTRENGQVLEINLQNKQTRVMSNAGENIFGSRIAGTWIYFISHDTDTPLLYRMSSTGDGKPESMRIAANRVLTDLNDRVYFTKPAMDGIFEMDTESGEENIIISDLPAERWKDWALKYPWLVHVRPDAHGSYVVVRTNLESNKQEVVTGFSPTTVGGSMDVSDDGNTLYVARTDRADLDIKMIELSD